MSYQVPVIEIRFLLKLDQYLRQRGLSIDDVLRDVGPDGVLTEHAWTVLPLSVAGRILDHAAKLLGDNALGLHFGASSPGITTGVLGQLIMAAPTVREMLTALVEHRDMHVRHIGLSYTETASAGRLEITYPACFAGPDVQVTGFFVAAVVASIRRAAGSSWTPRGVEFDHRPSEHLAQYVEMLGPRIKFGRPVNALTIDRAALSLPLAQVQPGLFDALREAGDRLKSDVVTVYDIANQVHREISSRLATGEPFDLERIADTMGLTPRALQYRLELQSTSYEAILIETRRRLAERYLRDTDLAITEISARLGFSELSAFTRAAQRWFAMPPRTYRNHMRGRTVEPRIMVTGYGRVIKATVPPARAVSARRSRGGSGSQAPRSSRP